MNDRIQFEQEAVKSLMELYEQSRKCRQLYERANMALPEALQRFFGMNGNSQKPNNGARVALSIPSPARPNEPEEAQPDWIWIDVRDASPTSVALAILREAKEPVPHKEIANRVNEILPQVPSGSISNIGTRLDGKIINRTDDGWVLVEPERAGIIKEGLLWGPPTIFGKQELAAHRRDAILHVLKLNSAGLQTTQIVEQLHGCSWVQAPVNKDLLKADLEVLVEAGKVRRRGNSRKWEIAPEKKPERRDSAKTSAE